MTYTRKEQSFIDYWGAVDVAMKKLYCIDTMDADITADEIASAQEEGWTPLQFAKWYGEKRDLTEYHADRPYQGN